MYRKKSQLGVSVIEIVIVTAIVGMISVLLFNLPNSLKLIGQSNHESLANQIVTEKIEGIRSLGYDNLANGTTAVVDTRLNQLPSQSSQVIIEDCQPPICLNNEQIKQVTVNVAWQDNNENKNVSVVTLVTKGGLQ